jgi:hypothetical protein
VGRWNFHLWRCGLAWASTELVKKKRILNGGTRAVSKGIKVPATAALKPA